MLLGNGVLPQEALATSKMQQRLGMLKVRDITDANRITAEILRLKPVIRLVLPRSLCDGQLVSISDASHGSGNKVYGQTGQICGMLAEDRPETNTSFTPLDGVFINRAACLITLLVLKFWHRPMPTTVGMI